MFTDCNSEADSYLIVIPLPQLSYTDTVTVLVMSRQEREENLEDNNGDAENLLPQEGYERRNVRRREDDDGDAENPLPPEGYGRRNVRRRTNFARRHDALRPGHVRTAIELFSSAGNFVCSAFEH